MTNQHFIDIWYYEFPHHLSEHIIYQTLEHKGGTIDPIWHYALLVVAYFSYHPL